MMTNALNNANKIWSEKLRFAQFALSLSPASFWHCFAFWTLNILFGLILCSAQCSQSELCEHFSVIWKLKTKNGKWNTYKDITMQHAPIYGVGKNDLVCVWWLCLCQRSHNLISLTEFNNCKLFKVFESLYSFCYLSIPDFSLSFLVFSWMLSEKTIHINICAWYWILDMLYACVFLDTISRVRQKLVKYISH